MKTEETIKLIKYVTGSVAAGENKKSFITGVGKHNGELISLLDLNSITLEENA